MKPVIITSGVLILAVLLSGCGQSSSSSNDSAKSAPPPQPATTPEPAPVPKPSAAPAPAPVTPTADVQNTPTPTPTTAAPEPTAATQAGADAVSQFASSAAAQSDKVAASIGSDLTAKANALAQSSATNPDLKNQVGSALQSLSAGKDANALTTLFQQAKQANLTPQQTQLVKDVGNLASAYVVQRNFSSINGAQGEVATIVNSLRKGSITPAIPALQSLAQNASLTSQQKDLLATVADQYAPGLKKATDSLKQGLQSIPGLGK